MTPNTVPIFKEHVGLASSITVRHIFVSIAHNFFGHHGRPASKHPMSEVLSIECVAGRGLQGDRFFDYKENYKGQITFFAQETYDALCQELKVADKPLWVFRRNIITAGEDLNQLIGKEFSIQGVRFMGTEECRPCYWMDEAFASGAFSFLTGRGGLRARILTDGILRSEAT